MYEIDTRKALAAELKLQRQVRRLQLLSNRIEDIQRSLAMYMNEPELYKKLHIQQDRLSDGSDDYRKLAECMQKIISIYEDCETRNIDYLEEVKISAGLVDNIRLVKIPQGILRLVR